MNKFIRYARIACRKAQYHFDLKEWTEEWMRLRPSDRHYYQTREAWD